MADAVRIGGTMKKKDSWILIVLGFALLFVVAISAYEQLSDKFLPEQGVTGETEEAKILAPDFIVYDLEGNEVTLSDFLGKPVVLNFWASWCGPCKSEMPDFQEVYEEYGEEIQFLMVNLTDGRQETVESASQYIADGGYSFPVYYDTESIAANGYGVHSVPRTYFIDEEGYLVDSVYRAIEKEELIRGIEKL